MDNPKKNHYLLQHVSLLFFSIHILHKESNNCDIQSYTFVHSYKKRPVETDLLGGKEIILLENNYILHSSCEKYMCNL